MDVTESGLTFNASSNGKDWVALASEPYANFLTIGGGNLDRYGLDFQNSANPFQAWFPSFGLAAP